MAYCEDHVAVCEQTPCQNPAAGDSHQLYDGYGDTIGFKKYCKEHPECTTNGCEQARAGSGHPNGANWGKSWCKDHPECSEDECGNGPTRSLPLNFEGMGLTYWPFCEDHPACRQAECSKAAKGSSHPQETARYDWTFGHYCEDHAPVCKQDGCGKPSTRRIPHVGNYCADHPVCKQWGCDEPACGAAHPLYETDRYGRANVMQLYCKDHPESSGSVYRRPSGIPLATRIGWR